MVLLQLTEKMIKNVTKKVNIGIFLIFLLAVIIRFLYFPNNVYFGYDQARDAYTVQEILSGQLKIVGPPSADGVFHHGVLYYYIFAFFYFISGGDPAAVAAFLRIFNAMGVFILYPIVVILFGEIAAFSAIILYAVSYEQTQFSLFLNHPSLVVISVLFFFFGLANWIFRKKNWGFWIALLGMGFSIQFQFIEVQLIPVFILFLIVFRKKIRLRFNKSLLIGMLAFILPLSTYIISEIIHRFFVSKQILNFFYNHEKASSVSISFSKFSFFITRHIHDNLISNNIGSIILAVILLFLFIKFIFKSKYKEYLLFILVWFAGGFLIYFFTDNDAYYYNTGTSLALLIFVSFLVSKLYIFRKWLAFLILILIFFSNVFLITKNNPFGPNERINPQKGLTLEDEKRIVDFIYQKASDKAFSVNALTMPYNVNTTWSYLFEWYGKKRYGYVPVWGGDAASGYYGSLKVNTARSTLPQKRFLIIEPKEGIPLYLVTSFLENESIYSTVKEKHKVGTMEVWVQEAK
ncbi:MAG: glycosyltransferase family 39 protein [Candidatus Daviesbacteria bacterium]|nr:glycosyltransferase family 39 protein [Candidatus Daviesbacteria bacterium]